MENIFLNLNQETKINLAISYENPEIIEKFCGEYEIDGELAKKYFIEVKKFLYLCANTNESLAPSAEIDKIWHTFILFTKDYRQYCLHFLGKFIDHIPKLKKSIEDRDELYIRLKKWLDKMASDKDINPYLLLSPKTLKAIVSKLPSTELELLAIKGLGKTKVTQFGIAIIGIVKDYCMENHLLNTVRHYETIFGELNNEIWQIPFKNGVEEIACSKCIDDLNCINDNIEISHCWGASIIS